VDLDGLFGRICPEFEIWIEERFYSVLYELLYTSFTLLNDILDLCCIGFL
jgi:hypothetical protein